MVTIKTLALVFALIAIACTHAPHGHRTPAGSNKIKNITLLNAEDIAFRLHESNQYKAVVLFSYGVGCPIARLLIGELNRLENAYPDVLFKFIYSNFDSRERNKSEVLKEISDYKIQPDVLLDNSMSVAKELGINRTCEALLIETKNFSVVYRGMVSEKFAYGIQKEDGTDYLEDAIKSFTNGRSVKIKQTDAKGCALSFPELSLDYEKRIAPIVITNCLSCHNDLGAAPFSFNGLNSLKKWSAMSQEVILSKRMPPRINFFHGMEMRDPKLAGLSSRDEADLLGFLQSALQSPTHKTSERDPLKLAHEKIVAKRSNWPGGTPDVIVELPENQLPESGLVRRLDAIMALPAELAGRWVERVDVTTTNPKVIHHRYVWVNFADSTKQFRSFDFEQKEEWQHHPLIKELIAENRFDWDSPLGALIKKRPLETKFSFDFQIMGYMLAASTQLEPQVGFDQAYYMPEKPFFFSGGHYKTTGKKESEKTSVGFYFRKSKKPPDRLPRFVTVQHDNFTVKSGEKKRVTSYYVTDREYMLHAINTHGHFRLRSQKITITTPAQKVYISQVPLFYYHSLFHNYLKTPVKLPAGTLVVVESDMDNTENNETNPNWKRDAKFSFQQWDEMIWTFLELSVPNPVKSAAN